MSQPLTIECAVHFQRRDRGRKELQPGAEPTRPAPEPGRIPRVSRLLALAIRFETLIRAGDVPSYADLARLGHVTPARVSQIMSLLHLAPDIQEQVLFLPRVQGRRDPVVLCDLLVIAATPDWRQQRCRWAEFGET
jgi:hypothetical protein